MKYINTFALFVIAFCLLVSPVNSTGAPTKLSAKQSSQGTENLNKLFKVAESKEPIYLILIEKDIQRLRVLEYDVELKVVAEYFSATGENFGIKEISGDAKTPEGIYFITQIFIDDEITIFGNKAFHLDYPNFFDLAAGRDGNGIYIHGTNKELEPNSTNGCITLINSDLDRLEQYLNQVVTPVVIVPKMDSININTRLLTENDFLLTKSLLLLDGVNPENVEYNYLYLISLGSQAVAVSDFIYRPFSGSIMRGASRTYLQFDPAQGWTAPKRLWRASPLQIFPNAPIKVAARPYITDDLQVAEQTPQDTAAMVAALSSPGAAEKNIGRDKVQNPAQPVTTKPLPAAVKKPQSKKTSLPEVTERKVAKAPVAQNPITPSPQKKLQRKIVQQKKMEVVQAPAITPGKQELIDFVENWRQAWVSQQIEPYIAFYAPSFKSGDKNLTEWKEHKAKLNKSYSYITVNISDINVRWTNSGATVSFMQKYRSDLFSATGIKTLYLVSNGPEWKISRETFSRM
jgi:murein L,D-transpeptidase YafK